MEPRGVRVEPRGDEGRTKGGMRVEPRGMRVEPRGDEGGTKGG